MDNIKLDDLMLLLKSDLGNHSHGSIEISNGIANPAFGLHLENVLRDEYYSMLLKCLIADFEEQEANGVTEVVKLQVTLDEHIKQSFNYITNPSLLCNVTSEMSCLLSKLKNDARCSFYQKYKDCRLVK